MPRVVLDKQCSTGVTALDKSGENVGYNIHGIVEAACEARCCTG